MQNMTKKLTLAGVAAVIMAASAGIALASEDREEADDITPQMVSAAKLNLGDAIAKAQTNTSGQVVAAELEKEDGKLAYSVEILSGGKIHEVMVDAASGAIIQGDQDS